MPAGTLVPERAIPPALAREPDNSVPPHLRLLLFELPSLCWRLQQGLWASKSVLGTFKRMPVSTAALSLTQAESLLILPADDVGTPFPGTDGPSWRACCEDGTHNISGGPCSRDMAPDS